MGRGGERLASLKISPCLCRKLRKSRSGLPRPDMSPDGIDFRQRSHAPGHAVPALFLCREGWGENNAESALKRCARLCAWRGRAYPAFVDSAEKGVIKYECDVGRKLYLAMGRRLMRTGARRMRANAEDMRRRDAEAKRAGGPEHTVRARFSAASHSVLRRGGMPERVAAHGSQAGEGGHARK